MTRWYGPKSADHSSVGQPCPACSQAFKAGDYTTLIALGPGADEDAQRACREGHAYNAVAVEVHLACATGYTNPVDIWADSAGVETMQGDA